MLSKLPTLGKLLILVTLADSALLIIMESERDAMLNDCFTYDGQLRANGHFAGGQAVRPPDTAMTLYLKNGKLAVTDGPHAETKDQLGGIRFDSPYAWLRRQFTPRQLLHAAQRKRQPLEATYSKIGGQDFFWVHVALLSRKEP